MLEASLLELENSNQPSHWPLLLPTPRTNSPALPWALRKTQAGITTQALPPAMGVPFLSGANSQTVRDSGAQSFGSRVKEAQPVGCGRNAVIGQNRLHLDLLGLQLLPQRPSAVRSSAASLRLYRLDAPDPLAGPGRCSGSEKCPLGPRAGILCGFTPICHGSLDR